MAKCDSCETAIIFGGYRRAGLRFCEEDCCEKFALRKTNGVPNEQVLEHMSAIRHGGCPRCGRNAPVDIEKPRFAWAAIVWSWTSEGHYVCCRRCGQRQLVRAMVLSFLFGWWAFPWGLISTPLVLWRNFRDLSARQDWPQGSLWLEMHVRSLMAAERIVAERSALDRRST